MPFTPTHILAVTPIAAATRGWLPLAALAIGGMVPDLPLFFPVGPDYATTHSLPGLFTACLPLGMVGFVVFQGVMKRPLIATLPAAVRVRCGTIAAPSPEPTLPATARVALAIVIGATTHVVWDAFTHRGRWGTQLVPGLDATVLTIDGHGIPGYKVLQYGSTAVGLPLLVLVAVVWLRRQVPAPLDSVPGVSRGARLWGILVTLGLVAIAGRPVWGGGTASLYERIGRAVRDSGLALMVGVLAYSLAFHAIEARRRSLTLRDAGGEPGV